MTNATIFDFMYPQFKFDKPTIRLFEAFAGVGSQAVALKQIAKERGFTLETVGISEIDKHAIASYNSIHGEVKNYGSITDIKEIPQVDIFTYSFPCQDISLAGKQSGFSRNSGTRSGLLWEVERILERQKEIGALPTVLLMENVKALVSEKFTEDFNEWQLKLQELGYTSYWDVLNAKDYGVPQNRERVFMVSILGEFAYKFPEPFELKIRLKDLLEDNVDEKYYLSDKMMKTFLDEGTGEYPRRERFIQNITGNTGQRPTDNFIVMPEDTKLGYALAKDGDGVYINRPHQKRGVVQDGMIQTLKTSPDVGVVVATESNMVLIGDLRIRKLTPKECWRLMGFDDYVFNRAKQVCSNSQLYKQAGNSIVVDVLYHIFDKLF